MWATQTPSSTILFCRKPLKPCLNTSSSSSISSDCSCTATPSCSSHGYARNASCAISRGFSTVWVLESVAGRLREGDGRRRRERGERRHGGRHGLAVCASTEVEKSESSVESKEVVRIDRKAGEWKKVEKFKESGAIHRGRIDACNSGGLLVRFGSLQGFLPFSQMDVSRVSKDGTKVLAEIAKELVGELISVKIIEVNEEERRLIMSEKQAVLVETMRKIQEGTIYNGKVNSVTDFGAFVDLLSPDVIAARRCPLCKGMQELSRLKRHQNHVYRQTHGSLLVSGLVHVSELSWDPVRNPRDVLEEGQSVRVKVIQVDTERVRLALSIKQLEADPLLETLDTLMPVEFQEKDENSGAVVFDAELLGTSLPGLEQICAEMLQEEGITGFTLGRQKLEKRVVSQDLELWLSNAPVEDGKFSLLARAGRQVQEVQLDTSLDREGIKAAVQRVTGRVP